MRGVSTPYQRAIAAIDAANSEDPQFVTVRGVTTPLALAHGRLAAEWVNLLAPDRGDEVVIAARAHHLRRWELPRSTYPDGRAGYLRWRRDQKARHATDVRGLLEASGYDAEAIERVQELIRRERLATDAGAQAVEDAACLVFIETQLAAVEPRFEHEHLLEVLRKTARKMSPAGLAAVERIDLGEHERGLLREALT